MTLFASLVFNSLICEFHIEILFVKMLRNMLLMEQAKIGIKKDLEDLGQVDQLAYPTCIRCVKNIRYTKIILSKISIGRNPPELFIF